MKIVLNLDEASGIVIDYLISNGKLEDKKTDVYFKMDNYDAKNAVIEFEQ